MALTRAEIELLIKGRNDAQGAFDQLGKQVGTVVEETDQANVSMDGLSRRTKTVGSEGEQAFDRIVQKVQRAQAETDQAGTSMTTLGTKTRQASDESTVAFDNIAKRLGVMDGEIVETTGSMSDLGKETQQVGVLADATAVATGGLRDKLNSMADTAGITYANLGKLGTGLAAVQAAALGFAIGTGLNKLLNMVVDLDGAVASLARRLDVFNLIGPDIGGLTPGLVEAAIASENLARASAAVGRAVKDQTEAAKILADVEAIRIAQIITNVDIQIRAVQAELDLGRISKETYNQKMLELTALKQVQVVQESRISLSASQAIAERRIQNEINATGMSLGQLLRELETNEAGFKRWANEQNLSADTVAFLESKVKAKTTALKLSREEAEKAAAAEDKLRESLKSMGLITETQVVKALDELARKEALAVSEGVPLEVVLRAMLPDLADLDRLAQASGISVDALAAAFQRAKNAMPPPGTLPSAVMGGIDPSQIGESVRLLSELEINQGLATRGLERLGLTSQAEYRRMANAARQAYDDIVKVYGAKSPEAIAAHKAMIDAMNKATGTIPGFWQTQVFPGVERTLQTISTAVQGSFAQMLLGTKSFKAGWDDVWNSLKAGALNILNQILSAFINSFLKGMLGAITGQQGAFGSAFSGLFSGIGGGGGGAGGMAGLPGFQAGPGAQQGGGGLFGMGRGLTGGLFGGITGGLTGFQMGSQGGTGRGVAGGILSGGLSGFAMGGPVGGLIGAGAGLIGGLIGGSKNNTKIAREQFAQQLGFRNIDELFAALQEKAPEQAAGLRNTALNVIGKKDNAANERWMQDVLKAFDAAEQKLQDLAATTQQYGLTWEDMDKTVQQTKISEVATQMLADQQALEAEGYRHDAVIRKQADSYSALVAKSGELGTELPAALKPVLQELIDLGLLVDANGNKITDFSGIVFAEATVQEQAVAKSAAAMKKTAEDLQAVREQLAGELTDTERAELQQREKDLVAFMVAAQAEALKGVTVPVFFDLPEDLPNWKTDYDTGTGSGGAGSGPKIPEAAGGVMASTPGLVVFGEGGETEVGGPKHFFKQVFRELDREDTRHTFRPGQASSGPGVRYDRDGRLVDGDGRRVDRDGRRIDGDGAGRDGDGGGDGGGDGAFGVVSGGGDISVSINFAEGAIQVVDAAGLDAAVQNRIIPSIVEAIRNNIRAARTNFRGALGVA